MQNITDAVVNPKTNRIMRTFTRTPQIRYNSNTVYGQVFQVDLPDNCQGLSQIYVKNRISCTGDNSVTLPYLGARLWSDIIIRTKSGITLLHQKPQYCISRIEEIGDPSNNPLVDATNPYAVFNNTTTYCITPVFPYFSEQGHDLFNVLKQEPCEILFTSALTKGAMGLPQDLTELWPEVFFRTYEPLLNIEFKDRMDQGFDVFYEEPVTVGANSSSITMNLVCPFDVYKTDVAVQDSDNASVQIDRIVIRQKGTIMIDLDRSMMYSLHSKKQIFYQESSNVPIFYTEDQTRSRYNKEFQRFTSECYPTEITVYFTSNPSVCTMTCNHEYRQYFFVDSKGKFMRPLMNLFESNNNF